ncbi:transmembrane protein [Trichonephila inaurata madagascariensis]|uniref:Transmembrane protein n=1 Tax=Trichonephila inaurata madagascariensis TaxID=2747483 RepID=A0A8X7BQN3_9ARAC|nr:transmembrane protein [Trichonephila inaurata madagascariensis]
MPRNGKKGLKKQTSLMSDVKLSDFANCSARAGRLRKSVGNSLSKEIEDVRNVEETLWYERELEDFQFLNLSTENRKKLRSKVTPEESLNDTGIRYPIDVWFLIGHYIKPEDVKVFASICKDSHFVSRSYSFWMKMYKRYYQSSDRLPARLQPECIEQAFCLKTRVVRALYQMYPSFINQLSTRLLTTDVYCLSNLCCTLMWRIQQNGKWLFHFKFKAATNASDSPITYKVAVKDWWTSQDCGGKKQDMYVNYNPDEGCKILRFACSHYVLVPPMVMGSRLRDVRVNLANDMRRQKLQLTFGHGNYRQSHRGSNMHTESIGCCDVVEFDAVENLMILNWWHPQYPFEYNA